MAEEFDLPKSKVVKILKEHLPAGTMLQKDARAGLSKAASVFIMYMAATAHDFALRKKRTTILAEDLLDAVDETEFEGFREALEETLAEFRASKEAKKSSSAVTSSSAGASSEPTEDAAGAAAAMEEDEEAGEGEADA